MPQKAFTVAGLPPFKTFGEMLKFLRRRVQMTQRELSIAIGYSISQISRLERNQRFPDPITVQAVFVPALDLEDSPDIAAQLVELAETSVAEGESDLEDLASAHHPLPASESTPIDRSRSHHLPHRIKSFVGRVEEIVTLQNYTASSRLVTLTGVGGVGKTNLALEVAKGSHFRDGVWFVELAAIREAVHVPKAICSALLIPESSNPNAIDALITFLRQKHLLLLLDNCEHQIDSCAEIVDQLLRNCPQLHILATSRESLGVDGEVRWLVAPLTIPTSATGEEMQIDAKNAEQFESIVLFLDRARTVQPGFALSNETIPSIARICSQLDGVPLAIELAAARLAGLTPQEIAEHLRDRFGLLTRGTRPASPRHQALYATIDWSYQLLPEEERRLFRRLSLFADGWRLDGAEVMLMDKQPCNQALHLLLQLVNKSLVSTIEREGQTRYVMLETIRLFAFEKLTEAGEQKEIQARFVTYLMGLAEQSHDVTLIGPALRRWLNRMAVEQNNLRRAFICCGDVANGPELRLRLAGALGLFWELRSEYADGITWLQEALAIEKESDPGFIDPTVKAIARSRLATLLHQVGRNEIELVEGALKTFTKANHPMGIGYCLLLLGRELSLDKTNHTEALEYYQTALQFFRDVGHRFLTGYTSCQVACALHRNGQPQEATAFYEECFDLANRHGDSFLTVAALEGLGEVNVQRALALCQRELTMQRQQQNPEGLTATLELLGRLLQVDGRYAEAQPILQECLALWQQLEIKMSIAGGMARAHLDLGHNFFWMQEYVRAEHWVKEALQMYAEVGDIHGVAWAQMVLGYIALQTEQIEDANTYFYASLQHTSDSQMNSLPLVFVGLGRTHQAIGDSLSAARFFGLAARFEDELHLIPSPLQQEFIETLAAARSQLVDQRTVTAWQAGLEMNRGYSGALL